MDCLQGPEEICTLDIGVQKGCKVLLVEEEEAEATMEPEVCKAGLFLGALEEGEEVEVVVYFVLVAQ